MIKRLFESYLFVARWLLAPFSVMLTLALFALMVNAGRHLVSIMMSIGSNTEDRIILELLRLVDLTLTGALVVIVTISVYENFVSGVSDANRTGWPEWMGGIDFSQLKFNLLSTIVAISAIKLLEIFMDVPKFEERDLTYYIAIHLTFVASTVLFAFSQWMTHAGPKTASGGGDKPTKMEAGGEPPNAP